MKAILGFAILLTVSVAASAQSMQLPQPSDMKTLGLIGRTSWHSTVEYYSYINEAVNDAYGNNTNPPLLLYNLNQRRIHELQAKNQWDLHCRSAHRGNDAAARWRSTSSLVLRQHTP